MGARTQVVTLPSGLAMAGDSRFIGSPIIGPPTSTTPQLPRTTSERDSRSRFGTTFSTAGFFWGLRKAIRQIKPDLIHSNGLKSHLCLAPLALHGCPVVWHIHDYYSQRPRIRRLVSLASRRATAGLPSRNRSPMTCEPSPVISKWRLSRTAWIPTIFNRDRRSRTSGFDRWFLPVNCTASRLGGYLCQLERSPGVLASHRPIAGGPRLHRGGPIYTTAGSQWTVDALRGQARELGISDRVGFVPFQSEPGWVYRSLDVVVHASTRPEPFGLTIVEAMACGRSVVVSAAGGQEIFLWMVLMRLGIALAMSIRSLRLLSDCRVILNCGGRWGSRLAGQRSNVTLRSVLATPFSVSTTAFSRGKKAPLGS